MKVIAAAVHASPVFMDTNASVQKAVEYIGEAGRNNVQFLVFPETFIPGYPYFIDCYPPRSIDSSIAAYQSASVEVCGPEIKLIQEAACRAKVVVVLGISERMRYGRTCFNSQVFINSDGSIAGVHRKLQPTFAERFVWGQGGGHTLRSFDTTVGRVGGLVCWEHTMNLARQALIEDREQIHAASWPGLSTLPGLEGIADAWMESIGRVHALTGQVFVVSAGNPVDSTCLDWMDKHIGPQTDVKLGGGYSSIIHPLNAYIAGPHTGGEEKLVVGQLDLTEVERVKVWIDGVGHYARPEILRMEIDRAPIWADERPGFQPSRVTDSSAAVQAGEV